MHCSTYKWLLLAPAAPALLLSLQDNVRRAATGPAPVSIDARYAALRAALPPGATEVGYVSDLPLHEGAVAAFYQTQYALAPHRLVAGAPGLRLVVADLRAPSRLADLCRERHLRPVVVGPGGLALLQPAER